MENEQAREYLRQEIEFYRQRAAKQDAEISNLHSEITRLKEAATYNYSDNVAIPALKAQIQMCVDDFNAEKREKERLSLELETVQRNLDINKQLLSSYQQTQSNVLLQRRQRAAEQYAQEDAAKHLCDDEIDYPIEPGKEQIIFQGHSFLV